jgi:hypothetical protein
MTRALCVQCRDARDCNDSDAGTFDCDQGTCVSFMSCSNSLGCPMGQVCDKQRARCVDCILDGDCGMDAKCVNSKCRKGCVSDKDCVAAGQLCDPSTSSCVSCVRNSDCGDGGLSCISGSCQQQLCAPGTTSCIGSNLATCSANGLSWGNIVVCDPPCATVGGVATCSGTGGRADVFVPPMPGACGDMIDDMEDGDGYICRGSGRVGQWYAYGSNITPPATPPPPAAPIRPSPVVPPRLGSTEAMHLMGSSITTVTGAALGVDLQLDGVTYGTYNASAYTGISFYAKGNVNIDVLVDSGPTTSPAYGGRCSSICTPAQTTIPLTPTWTLYRLPFDTFLPGNGGQTPIDRASLTHFQFRVATAALGTDLWIDDLSFVR